MPRQPRSPASASPTGPPPTMRTGVICSWLIIRPISARQGTSLVMQAIRESRRSQRQRFFRTDHAVKSAKRRLRRSKTLDGVICSEVLRPLRSTAAHDQGREPYPATASLGRCPHRRLVTPSRPALRYRFEVHAAYEEICLGVPARRGTAAAPAEGPPCQRRGHLARRLHAEPA